MPLTCMSHVWVDVYIYISPKHMYNHVASPLVEQTSEAYLPVVFVKTKACMRSSMNGLVSLAIQMEQTLSNV